MPATKPARLSAQEEAFCQAFVAAGMGYGAGAKAFGEAYPKSLKYSPKVRSSKASAMLVKPKIAARVDELANKVRELAEDRFLVNEARIIEHLAKLGFASLETYIRVEANGQPVVDLSKVDAAGLYGLAEITIEDIDTGKRSGTKTKVKLPDRVQALVKLGQHIGMFKKSVSVDGDLELGGKGGGAINVVIASAVEGL